MAGQQRIRLLSVPAHPVDVVLDTDTYNEIDDQFALSYLLLSGEKLRTKALFAAPFFNENSSSPADGMERSYGEILRLLSLLHREDMKEHTFRGSLTYLPDEKTPVESPAARKLIALSEEYNDDNPLYVVAIGCITNVASALLLDPTLAERIAVVWLGGRAQHFPDCTEFNMSQDIAAARVVMGSGVPFIQVPCAGVADHFATTKPELEYWLKGVNPLADYLACNTIAAAEKYAHGKPWSRVIWDVTAVGFLLNDGNRFMRSEVRPIALPGYTNLYEKPAENAPLQGYVSEIWRDALFNDLFTKLREFDPEKGKCE